jgi:hypothetical protein
MRQRIANIECILNAAKPGRVRVSGYIHPGTRVSIGALTKSLNDSLQFISFYVVDGELRFSSLR